MSDHRIHNKHEYRIVTTDEDMQLLREAFGRAVADGEIGEARIRSYYKRKFSGKMSFPRFLEKDPVGRILRQLHVGEWHLEVNAQDSDTVKFLQAIGLDPGQYDDGLVTLEEWSAAGLSLPQESLKQYLLSAQDRLFNCWRLHPSYLPNFVAIADKLSPEVMRTFFQDSGDVACEQAESQVFGNLNASVSWRRYVMGFGEVGSIPAPRSACPAPTLLARGYPAQGLIEMYFAEPDVDDRLRAVGASVVAVHDSNKNFLGNAVVASAAGHVLSAGHVLFAGDQIRKGAAIEVAGRLWPIRPEHVLYHANDLCVLLLPELAQIPDLPIASIREDIPTPQETLISIGHTMIMSPLCLSENGIVVFAGMREDFAGGPKRVYTYGDLQVDSAAVANLQSENGVSEEDRILLQQKQGLTFAEMPDGEQVEAVATRSGVRVGMSGGGAFDERGYLWGLHGWIATKMNLSMNMPLVPALIEDPELKALIEEIIALQKASQIQKSDQVTLQPQQ